MTQYLLDPKVRVTDIKYLTQAELCRMMRKLKNRKFGFKDFAVDVEEVTLEYGLTVEPKIRSDVTLHLKPGTYFNVHVEYVV